MCQQLANSASSNNSKHKTVTYSLKKVLKTFFKKQQKSSNADNLEGLKNLRNTRTEPHEYFSEIEDNSANEKLAVIAYEQEQDEDIYVPVRFARTAAGTFFWTTNLQPVTGTIMPAADEDLLQPAYCYSNYQYPIMQFQDRWAQA